MSNSIFLNSDAMGRVESHSNDLFAMNFCTIVNVNWPAIDYIQKAPPGDRVGAKRRHEEL